ncbi:hypothetical protein OROHE_012502 [Orobanche hederae]
MASKEHQVAVPETGKPDGDVQYFDSELDSDDDVQQTGDGAPNPPSQEGPSVRRRIAFEEILATRQEMLDPSDTQMNTMFDELVCLGELTAPAQGILAGVGGATGGLEQPIVRMYVDATPPAQSIIPYAVESSSHSPIQTMAVQEIPKVILNVRPIRRRFPARAIRSPFLHDDIRGGDTLDEYLKLEDGGMYVVTVCNYNDHWGTLLLDLKRQTIWLYDSMAWKFDYHHVCNRRDVFLPMTRIVPQILKRIGYYELHRVKKPQFAQWDLCSHRLRKIFSSKMTVLIVVSTH